MLQLKPMEWYLWCKICLAQQEGIPVVRPRQYLSMGDYNWTIKLYQYWANLHCGWDQVGVSGALHVAGQRWYRPWVVLLAYHPLYRKLKVKAAFYQSQYPAISACSWNKCAFPSSRPGLSPSSEPFASYCLHSFCDSSALGYSVKGQGVPHSCSACHLLCSHLSLRCFTKMRPSVD